jgi:glycosyltransferase involved in cell wall biosynthesis
MDLAPEKRNPLSILMLHHEQSFKGTAHGLKTLERVRKQYPELKVTLFGAQPHETGSLPEWIHFVLRPAPKALRELYNAHAIFISPSLSEGWALPPAEAMRCGCATVLTNIGGHEYAVEGVTSLLCPPEDPERMAEEIVQLIQNPGLRITLGRSAEKEIAKYTWSRATDRLLDDLLNAASNDAPV